MALTDPLSQLTAAEKAHCEVWSLHLTINHTDDGPAKSCSQNDPVLGVKYWINLLK